MNEEEKKRLNESSEASSEVTNEPEAAADNPQPEAAEPAVSEDGNGDESVPEPEAAETQPQPQPQEEEEQQQPMEKMLTREPSERACRSSEARGERECLKRAIWTLWCKRRFGAE